MSRPGAGTAPSFWLETAGDDLTPRPRLDGSTTADVAILGAGFTGLWTAYALLERDPALRVVVLEREIAGFGASGRNGSWCAPDLNVSLDTLVRRHGREAAVATLDALAHAVDEIGRVCVAEGIEADYVKGGALTVARGPHHRSLLEAHLRSYERHGLGDRWTYLDPAALAGRIRVAGAVGALASPDFASVHPGRLVRGLARAVERRGGRIHEATPVIAFEAGEAGRQPRLRTPYGDVRAAAVVLAGEAYLSELPQLHRQVLPIYSLIVLTEPIPDAAWREIGWAGRECVSSYRLTIDYLARTADGRILFGGRGAPYRFGSRVDPAFDHHPPTHAGLREMATRWFPAIRDVRFSHAWGGPLGVPRDWMPTIAHDRRTGTASARGYTGHGVSTANLAGRTLADLILERPSPLASLPLVGHRSPDWEIEPFRWLGVRFVQRELARLDAKMERTGRGPTGRSLAELITRH